MADRSIRPRLLDILESINLVAEAIRREDFDSFQANAILRLAIERAVEIVSEAVRHIPEQDRSRFAQVPWRNISAIGNKLRHEYQRIDNDIIWEIATVHLPELRPVIATLLDQHQ